MLLRAKLWQFPMTLIVIGIGEHTGPLTMLVLGLSIPMHAKHLVIRYAAANASNGRPKRIAGIPIIAGLPILVPQNIVAALGLPLQSVFHLLRLTCLYAGQSVTAGSCSDSNWPGPSRTLEYG